MIARELHHIQRFIIYVLTRLHSYSGDHDKSMETLFNSQEELYTAGARNFMFIDVPPIHLSPASKQTTTSSSNSQLTTAFI